MTMPTFKLVSDCALLVELGTSVDDDINRMIVNLDGMIAQRAIAGVKEVVPALVNLLVVFDPLTTDHRAVRTEIEALLPLDNDYSKAGRRHALKVCYDGEFCPDLEQVAIACGLSSEAVINVHTSVEYRVSMYGFAPGFAYLTGVPKAIQVPRKAKPVRDIPKGSVMIAGPQCLTTTVKMPTGWSIIGRSDANIITDDNDRPFLFDVGDTVTFKRVKADDLDWVAQ